MTSAFSTQKCYRNGWRKWEAFALEHGASLFPADPEALAAFTWGQIERRPDGSATITFRRPKTDADTTAYLAPATVAALDAIRRSAADTAPVFGLSTGQIKRRIQAAAKAAGLEGVSSHGCRIGMAQDLARSKGIEMHAIPTAPSPSPP